MFLAAGALRFPQRNPVQGPIPEWIAVRFFAPRNRARDADKLGPHLIGRQAFSGCNRSRIEGQQTVEQASATVGRLARGGQ
jgi:hypothetical protein